MAFRMTTFICLEGKAMLVEDAQQDAEVLNQIKALNVGEKHSVQTTVGSLDLEPQNKGV